MIAAILVTAFRWLLPYLARAGDYDGLNPPAGGANFQIYTGIPGPVPITGAEGYGILGYIQNAYLLALGVAGALAIGSIIYGAVQYTASKGNPSKLSDAWDRIVQALVGLLLLVGAGTLLSIVNPGLLSLELPKIAKVDTPFSGETYTLEAVQQGLEAVKANENNPTYQVATGGKCQPLTAGQSPDCNPAALQAYGNAHNCSYQGKVWDGTFMSLACKQESNGRRERQSGTDRCNNNGNEITFSVGLFQVNIMGEANNAATLFPACRGVMGPYTTSKSSTCINGHDARLGTCVKACRPVGSSTYCPLRNCGLKKGVTMAQFNACIAQLSNPENNLARACALYKAGGIKHWKGTASLLAKTCRR